MSDGLQQAIFVINLAHRSDRRAEMEAELARVGWSHSEFFPAIRPQQPDGFESTGARGCFLSHLEVLRTAQTRSLDRVIILEDDLNFATYFVERWPLIVSELAQKEWSIFYAGHILSGLNESIAYVEPSTEVRCSHFMIVNAEAVDFLVRGLETILSRPAGHPLGGPMHIDGAYSTLRRQNPDLKTLAVCPVLGSQRASRTDIANPRWFDKVRVLDPVLRAARRWRERER